LIIQLELAAILISSMLLEGDNSPVMAYLTDLMVFHNSRCCFCQQFSGVLGRIPLVIRWFCLGWHLDTLSRRRFGNHGYLPYVLVRPNSLR